MHFTLLVAGALIPADLSTAIAASLNLPNLQARLARAESTIDGGLRSDTGDTHLDWLAREMFGQAPAPTAPYAFAQLCGRASPAFLWHADPVHIEVARDHLIVHSLGIDDPTAEESVQLIEAANSVTLDVGCELIAAGGRWFIKCDHDWDIDTLPLAAVTGTAMVLPTGADSQTWNRLHNEVQMVWHTHAVNQLREQKQQPVINGIWLHGGGRWRELPPLRYAQVHADAPALQGAAQAAGARGVPLASETLDRSLIVIDQPAIAGKGQDWAAWSRAMMAVDERLSAHARDSIDLIASGRTVRTFRSQPTDRYIFWRRRTLAEALAE